MRRLYSIQKSVDNARGLRNFLDQHECHIRALEALGKTTESYGDLLIPIILDKLPPSIRKNLARVHRNEDFSLEELRQSLRHEAEILEEDVFTIDLNQSSQYRANESSPHFEPTAATFHTSETRDHRKESPIPYPCVYCDKTNHASSQCKIVPTRAERMKILDQKNRCTNCLSAKHKFEECTSKFHCRKCKRKHHTSICNASQEATQHKEKQFKFTCLTRKSRKVLQ